MVADFRIETLLRNDDENKNSKSNGKIQSRPLHPYLSNVQALLEQAELWRQFNRLGTEMIVTKSGR